jgi:cytidylate kinase
MTADLNLRAYRRQQELLAKKQMVNLEDIINNLLHRDHIDTTRKESPLVQAADSFLIDTCYMTVDEQVEMVVNLAQTRMLSNAVHE